MKYTTYFFEKRFPQHQHPYCVGSPIQEFHSLEDARTFSQNAANVSLHEVESFRIETDDGKINEFWNRDGDGWKLKG